MNISSKILIISLPIFLLFGCKTNDVNLQSDNTKEVFKYVADNLETGGSYYAIANQKSTLQLIENISSQWQDALLKQTSNNIEIQKKLALTTANITKMWLNSGANKLLSWGASSVKNDDNLYSNKGIVLLSSDINDDDIWQILGKENKILTEEWGRLPQNTVLALSVELNIKEFAKKQLDILSDFPNDMKGVNNFLEVLKNMDSFNGTFGLYVLNKNDNEYNFSQFTDLQIIATIPDKEKIIYDFIGAIITEKGKAKSLENRVINSVDVLGIKGLEVTLDHSSEGETYVYIGKDAVFALLDEDAKKLKDTNEFKTLSKDIPNEALAYFYFNGKRNNVLGKFMSEFLKINNLDFESVAPINLSTIKKEKNAFLYYGKSNYDFNQQIVLGNILNPLLNINYIVNNYAKFLQAQKIQNNKILDKKNQLEDIYKNIKAYSAKNGGKYPKTISKVNGSVSQLYLGEIQNNIEKYPLLIVKYQANIQSMALLNDGSIIEINSKKLNNFRKIVSFLHSVNKYKEKDFKELFKLAGKVDEENEKNK